MQSALMSALAQYFHFLSCSASRWRAVSVGLIAYCGSVARSAQRLAVIVACLLLFGCDNSSYSPSLFGSDIDSSSLAGNRNAAKLMTEYNKAHQAATVAALLKRLHRVGVEVISVGQDYMVTIPSNRLFYVNSPRIRWSSYALLDNIADYLKQYTKVSVRVACYTDNLGATKRNAALSESRARKVSDYLWSQHIGARMMHTKGYGAAKPLYPNNTKQGVEINNRIEITFRNVVA